MDLQAFRQTLKKDSPPDGVSELAVALWWDARGDWGRAHGIAQKITDANGAWVHAYLHRKEGDSANAAYWYRRAGRAVCTLSLGEEWQAIVDNLLK